MALIAESAPRRRNLGRLLFAGGVAVAATAAAVAVVAVVTADDDGTTTATAPDQTFEGAALTTTAIEEGTNPYFVAAGDEVLVASLGGDLTRLDARTGEVVATATIPESSPIAVDERAIWVASAVEAEVLRLDPDTLEVVARIPTGVDVADSTIRLPMLEGTSRQFSNNGGIVSDGESVFVGDRAGRVQRIDPDADEIVESFDVGVRPDHLQLEGELLLVADPYGGEAVVVDATDGEELLRAPEARRFAGAALFGGAVYVQDVDTGVVTRIDVETGDSVSSETLGASLELVGQPTLPTGLRVGAAGVLVDVDGEPSLHVLDPVTLEELGTLAVSADAGDMTIGVDGSAWLVRMQARQVVHIEPRDL